MKSRILLVLIAVTGFQFANAASSEKGSVTQDKFHVGAGLLINSVDRYDDATGFQIFGGLAMPFVWANASHSVELGYMDSGDFDFNAPGFNSSVSATGVWGSYNLAWTIYDNMDLFARAGYDVGDDDGVLIGGGAEFHFNAPVKLRVEFVKRDEIDSFQLNLVLPL